MYKDYDYNFSSGPSPNKPIDRSVTSNSQTASEKRECEELTKAIDEMDFRDLQAENLEKSMLLAFQFYDDPPPTGSLTKRCSNCTLDNPPDRVQCMACGVELHQKERDLAPGFVTREQIALGPRVYDNGGTPDVNILGPLGFLGKKGNACMVNATAFVVNKAHLLPKDLETLSCRITKDCKANPGGSMWSDLLGVWFEGLDFKINIMYGPVNPTDKFQSWASLRKFNPEFRTLIIGNTGSHYSVYSPA